MTSKERNRLYLFWTVALLACFFMAMFAAFFASCSKRDLSRDAQPSDTADTPAAAAGLLPEDNSP